MNYNAPIGYNGDSVLDEEVDPGLTLRDAIRLIAAAPAAPAAATVADAIATKTMGARTLSQHIQAQSAALLGATTGAGTSHLTFTDGAVTVEADVPLPGQTGNRSNVVISGV